MDGPDINPRQILALLLGASSFQRAPKLAQGRAFYDSARDFYEYLIDPAGLSLPEENAKWLFDDTRSPSDLLKEIRDFLERRTNGIDREGTLPQDLILFYVGHGLFAGADYCLAVGATDERDEGPTSIPAKYLASVLKSRAGFMRKFLIMDCCFSATIYRELMSGPLTASRSKLLEELPSRGTTLLCSANAHDVSLAPHGHPRTMFSGSLLKALREGHPLLGPRMSLSELGDLTKLLIKHSFPDSAVLPEVHSPDKREGDIAGLPLFPNAAWKASQPTQPRMDEAQEVPERNQTQRRNEQESQVRVEERAKERAALSFKLGSEIAEPALLRLLPSGRPDFSIKVFGLPSGDCLILKVQSGDQERLVLIDAGTEEDFPQLGKRLQAHCKRAVDSGKMHFDLVVGTHLHDNHIGGVLALVKDQSFTWDKICINALPALLKLPKSTTKKIKEAPARTLCQGARIALQIAGALEARGAMSTLVSSELDGFKLRDDIELQVVCPERDAYRKLAKSLPDFQVHPDSPDGMHQIEESLRSLGSIALCLTNRHDHLALLTSDAQESSLIAGMNRLGLSVKDTRLQLLQIPEHGFRLYDAKIKDFNARRYLITGRSTNSNVFRQRFALGKKFSKVVFAEDEPEIDLCVERKRH